MRKEDEYHSIPFSLAQTLDTLSVLAFLLHVYILKVYANVRRRESIPWKMATWPLFDSRTAFRIPECLSGWGMTHRNCLMKRNDAWDVFTLAYTWHYLLPDYILNKNMEYMLITESNGKVIKDTSGNILERKFGKVLLLLCKHIAF